MMKTEFINWLELDSTIELATEVAYDYGDIVRYRKGDLNHPEDALFKILYAAWNAATAELAKETPG